VKNPFVTPPAVIAPASYSKLMPTLETPTAQSPQGRHGPPHRILQQLQRQPHFLLFVSIESSRVRASSMPSSSFIPRPPTSKTHLHVPTSFEVISSP
jgi:hypothetical protein